MYSFRKKSHIQINHWLVFYLRNHRRDQLTVHSENRRLIHNEIKIDYILIMTVSSRTYHLFVTNCNFDIVLIDSYLLTFELSFIHNYSCYEITFFSINKSKKMAPRYYWKVVRDTWRYPTTWKKSDVLILCTEHV